MKNSIQWYINDYNFIIKHTIQGQPQKETHQVRLERSWVQNFHVPHLRVSDVPSSWSINVFTIQKFTSSSVSRVFTEVSLCKHDWFPPWPRDWTPSLAPLSSPDVRWSSWYYVAQSHKPLNMWLVFWHDQFPARGISLAKNSAMVQGSVMNKRYSDLSRNHKVLAVPS